MHVPKYSTEEKGARPASFSTGSDLFFLLDHIEKKIDNQMIVFTFLYNSNSDLFPTNLYL